MITTLFPGSDGGYEGIGVDETTHHAYVSDVGYVTVVDGTTQQFLANIQVDHGQADVAVNPVTDKAFVANTDTDDVSVVDTATNAVVATVPVGDFPEGVVADPDRNLAYVADVNSGAISIIGPGTPLIVSFSPSAGVVGKSVTLTGSGFTGTTAVSFNGTPAAFTVASDTSIQTTVPDGATTGRISVMTPGGSASTQRLFHVKPKITSFDPTSGPPGTSVTINGSAFDGVTAVRFNGESAAYSVVSYYQVVATVPSGATTGRISVRTKGGNASSKTDFTVTVS